MCGVRPTICTIIRWGFMNHVEFCCRQSIILLLVTLDTNSIFTEILVSLLKDYIK